jgi:hypothetical protein
MLNHSADDQDILPGSALTTLTGVPADEAKSMCPSLWFQNVFTLQRV